MKINYKIAMAAGQDAANRRMKSSGRTKWNRADYNEAARVTNGLLSAPRYAPVCEDMQRLGDRAFQRILDARY